MTKQASWLASLVEIVPELDAPCTSQLNLPQSTNLYWEEKPVQSSPNNFAATLQVLTQKPHNLSSQAKRCESIWSKNITQQHPPTEATTSGCSNAVCIMSSNNIAIIAFLFHKLSFNIRWTEMGCQQGIQHIFTKECSLRHIKISPNSNICLKRVFRINVF